MCSFAVALPLVRRIGAGETKRELADAQARTHALKPAALVNDHAIVFACDVGMGFSVVGPAILRRKSAGWHSVGWNLTPRTPRLSGKIVFLTDERAISYAESVMGYVADRKLGTIVGSTTAGTNGNVATFPVPGGFTIAFTGMRVTGHDGRTPFHLVGIKPDISVVSTLAGLRDGRDEVLERALAVIRGE